jgi:hypothetical protein
VRAREFAQRRASASEDGQRRRSGRRITLLVGAAIVALVVVVTVAVASLGGGGSSRNRAVHSSSTGSLTRGGATRGKARLKASSKSSGAAASQAAAADTPITVLNGTETAGLAHRISASLQQRGYSQAAALSGRPPGSGQISVVQYTAGHKPEAEAVARSLSIAQVQPLEAAVAALAGSAKVVVIVGADKAAASP